VSLSLMVTLVTFRIHKNWWGWFVVVVVFNNDRWELVLQWERQGVRAGRKRSLSSKSSIEMAPWLYCHRSEKVSWPSHFLPGEAVAWEGTGVAQREDCCLPLCSHHLQKPVSTSWWKASRHQSKFASYLQVFSSALLPAAPQVVPGVHKLDFVHP